MIDKDKIKLLKQKTDEKVSVEVLKQDALVVIEKNPYGKTKAGNNKYAWRVIVHFIFTGKPFHDTFIARSLRHALKHAEEIFASRQKQTLVELKRLGLEGVQDASINT